MDFITEGALVTRIKGHPADSFYCHSLKPTPRRTKNNCTSIIIPAVIVFQTVIFTFFVIVLHTRIRLLETEAILSTRMRADVENRYAFLEQQMSEVQRQYQHLFNSNHTRPAQDSELNTTEAGHVERANEFKVNKTNQIEEPHEHLDRLLQTSISLPSDVAVHLKGGLPELLIKDKGVLGPWYTTDSIGDFRLDSSKSSVIVQSDGLYFIYAQVYYLDSGGANSFSIMRRQVYENDETMATCSSNSVVPRGNVQEVSCFTATVARLSRGDTINLVQREKNRRVLFREGQTYFGLTKLNRLHA